MTLRALRSYLTIPVITMLVIIAMLLAAVNYTLNPNHDRQAKGSQIVDDAAPTGEIFTKPPAAAATTPAAATTKPAATTSATPTATSEAIPQPHEHTSEDQDH